MTVFPLGQSEYGQSRQGNQHDPGNKAITDTEQNERCDGDEKKDHDLDLRYEKGLEPVTIHQPIGTDQKHARKKDIHDEMSGFDRQNGDVREPRRPDTPERSYDKHDEKAQIPPVQVEHTTDQIPAQKHVHECVPADARPEYGNRQGLVENRYDDAFGPPAEKRSRKYESLDVLDLEHVQRDQQGIRKKRVDQREFQQEQKIRQIGRQGPNQRESRFLIGKQVLREEHQDIAGSDDCR